ncbi:DMT family transporter [Streptomyces sp. NPDC048018]|uniref:DMT family transporter n=1 Tax=Streptomyces sp. NPDC048018 TaxID=3365499 RepID=UPI00371409A4
MCRPLTDPSPPPWPSAPGSRGCGTCRPAVGLIGLIGLLNPVTGVLLGTVVAGETLTVKQLCGLVLVLTGVVAGRPGSASRRDTGGTPPASGERTAQTPTERTAC